MVLDDAYLRITRNNINNKKKIIILPPPFEIPEHASARLTNRPYCA